MPYLSTAAYSCRLENIVYSADQSQSSAPVILTVPGLHGAPSGHWQRLWKQTRQDCVEVELGSGTLHRNVSVTKLDQAIRSSQAPVILVGHCLGAMTIAWWAELAGQPWSWPVTGALLVAPPDVDRADAPDELKAFGPSPRTILPFPSILVASDDDPFASPQRAFDMARDWGSHFVDAGSSGHFTAASGLGCWHEGQELLERLIAASGNPIAHAGGHGDIQAVLQAETSSDIRI